MKTSTHQETRPNDSIKPILNGSTLQNEGLSKREYFASMALQGLLANINQSFGAPNVNKESMEDSLEREKVFIDDVCIKSVRYSEALINALNK